jgi:hypothetical protein
MHWKPGRCRLEANHGLLLDLAAGSQGSFYHPAENAGKGDAQRWIRQSNASTDSAGIVGTAPGSVQGPSSGSIRSEQMDGRLSELLAERIRAESRIKPILHERVQTRSAIYWRWAFGLLLFLLAAEWILRKALGRY